MTKRKKGHQKFRRMKIKKFVRKKGNCENFPQSQNIFQK